MANPTSFMQTGRQPDNLGVIGAAGVTLEEISGFGMVQISAWGATLAQTGAEVAAMAGCAQAPMPGQSVAGSKAVVLRVEPLKWWLVTPPRAVISASKLAPDVGAVLDMQDSRCWLRVGGDHAEILLNHFLPLNLRPSAFPVRAVASTVFHHVGVTLWREEKHFNMLIPRSSAQSLCELLFESARQYGVGET